MKNIIKIIKSINQIITVETNTNETNIINANMFDIQKIKRRIKKETKRKDNRKVVFSFIHFYNVC